MSSLLRRSVFSVRCCSTLRLISFNNGCNRSPAANNNLICPSFTCPSPVASTTSALRSNALSSQSSVGTGTAVCHYPSWWTALTTSSSSLACRSYCTLTGDTTTGQELHWSEVDTLELVELVQKGEVQLIDVRELCELEYTGTVAPNAINIPLEDVEEALQMTAEEFKMSYGSPQPEKTDHNIVFYCMAGVRSWEAMECAHSLGYTKARHYIRGWLGWKEYLDRLENQD